MIMGVRMGYREVAILVSDMVRVYVDPNPRSGKFVEVVEE